jgi:hypothetical protein
MHPQVGATERGCFVPSGCDDCSVDVENATINCVIPKGYHSLAKSAADP